MISSISIHGYRGFEHFEMADLGRINLLVGTNNSGKTSILEVVSILESAGDLGRLWNILWRRGERTYRTLPPLDKDKNPAPRIVAEGDVAHLFYGHEVHPGTSLSISTKNAFEKSLVLEIRELSPSEKVETQFIEDIDDSPLPRMALHLTGSPAPGVPVVVLSRNIGLPGAQVRRPKRSQAERPVQFISTESSTAEEVLAAWSKVSLKPEEKLVLQALQALDSNIQGIALQPRTPQQYWGPGNRGGFIVKLKSSEQPVPIGSMGDGIWRMLALAIAIALSKGGTLLVDEIDTGLHYAVMSKMWNLIYTAAKEFDVQVFATTHSYDCVYSLAQICPDADSANRITVQRIEANKHESIPYDQDEISVAAAREIEVR